MADIWSAQQASAALRHIFLVELVDLTCAGLFLPLLPLYAAADFGASPSQIGLLMAAYSFTQFLASPVLGRISDSRLGRRAVLVACLACMAGGYHLLASATSLGMLFASRMLAGAVGANNSIASAYITDVTTHERRARSLGLVGLAFGLGFTVGPALGGYLSHVYGFRTVAHVASAGSLLAASVATMLPDPPRAVRNDEGKVEPVGAGAGKPAADGEKRRGRSLSLLTAFRRQDVGDLLMVRFLYGIPFYIFRNTFSLFTGPLRLGLSARESGLALAYLGLLVGAFQGGGVRVLVKRMPERVLVRRAVPLFALSLVAWAMVSSVWQLAVVLVPMAVAIGCLVTLTNSLLSKAVAPDEVGWVLGCSSSVDSLTKVLAPTIAGYVVEWYGATAPGLVGAGVLAALAAFIAVKDV